MGRMVLLIPAAWKKIKEQGRVEGRAEERQRILDAVTARLGEDAPSEEVTRTLSEILKVVRGDSNGRP